MERLPDWEPRLHAYLVSVADTPHDYGSNHCLLHAANAVRAVTGKDLARGHRGKFKDAIGAVRYLKSLGFDSPAAMIDSALEETPIGFAQRGDLVLVPGDALPGGEQGWDIPASCVGDVALVVGDDGVRRGLFRVPRSAWLKAWKVGASFVAAPSTPTGAGK